MKFRKKSWLFPGILNNIVIFFVADNTFFELVHFEHDTLSVMNLWRILNFNYGGHILFLRFFGKLYFPKKIDVLSAQNYK